MSETVLRYVSRRPTVADQMARVVAAGRITAERRAEQRRAARAAMAAGDYADHVLSVLAEEGAVRVGFKVCDDTGKWRTARDITDPGCRALLVSTYGEDAEVWGIGADGEHTSGGSVY